MPIRLLYVCFFASGLTGLIYELVWLRRLQLTFGSTTYSVSTTIAAFMAGLGLGAYLLGRWVDRRGDGVRVYALLELGLACYALLSLPALSGVEWLFAAAQRGLELGPLGATMLRFALAFPVLAIPAAMMGGTLPALLRGTLRRRRELHGRLGRLYGINTAGAALGTALCGFVLIEKLGLWRTVILCAAVNGTVGLLVLRLARRREASPAARREQPQVRLRQHLQLPEVRYAALAATLCGALSLGYEVIYTRLLGLVVGSSTYAFTIVLTVFLVGVAVGALLLSRRTDRAPDCHQLALLLLALALWVTLTIAAMPALPHALFRLGQLPAPRLTDLLAFEALLAVALLGVPTLIFGAALPLSVSIATRALGQLGRDVGGLYLANTAGGIGGSLLAGFLLIPLLGTRAALVVCVAVNVLLAAAGALRFAPRPPQRWVASALGGLLLLGCVLAPEWPPLLFDSGLTYRLGGVQASDAREGVRLLHRTPSRLLMLREGVNATISVRDYTDGRTLLINGKPDASTSNDMTTQTMLGLLPMAAHPRPLDVAVVGWGAGVTVHVATLLPSVRRVDAVEIEAEVVAASRHFHRVNGAAERHPKVNVAFADARSFFATTARRYDVIISEPSNPWVAGIASLFTIDFYRQVRARLRPGGIFVQWLQLYAIDAGTVALVLRTLLAGFPHVQAHVADSANLVLLASPQQLRLSHRRLARLYRRAPALARLAAVYGSGPDPAALPGAFLLGTAELRRLVRRFPQQINSDDHPLLEYRALRGLLHPFRRHLSAMVAFKLAAAPPAPTSDRPPRPGIHAVGTARLLAASPPLALKVIRSAISRHGPLPHLQLALARVELLRKRPRAVREALRPVPRRPPWSHAVAELTARAELLAARPREALAALAALGDERPVVRWELTLRAAVAAGRQPLALGAAERLLPLLHGPPDADAMRVSRHEVYLLLDRLARVSRDPGRVARLLARQPEDGAGEFARLLALVGARQRLGAHREAASALDELRRYRVANPRLLALCRDVYRAAGRPAAAARCEAERRRISPSPASPPLWP